jgi:trigger factor
MPAAVTASVTELPESRVRVQAEVTPDEVERRIEQTARALGRQMKIPGFRKGKVPPPVVVRRVGRGAVLDETVRDALGSWYMQAIDAAGIAPVGDPKLDLDELPGEGRPLTFSIEIGVTPRATLGEHRGLEVGRREPEVSDVAIDGELEALRERLARLEAAEGEAQVGDFLVLDFKGTVGGDPLEGGEGRHELVELGAGRLPEEMDRELVGAKASEIRTVAVAFPDDHASEQLAGKTADFEVTVHEVKRKQLPDLDDDFAADAAGFDTLDELREDTRARLAEAEDRAIESEFRTAALDAAVAGAQVEVPDALVDGRARELWSQLSRTMERQGISQEAYLKISGKEEAEIIGEAKPDAEQALRREAVLAAVVEAESIEPTEQELLEALEHSAEHEKTTPAKLLERLRKADRVDALARDIATRKAVDVIAESAKAISVEQAKARDKLWTPGKEDAEGGSKTPSKGKAELWTPGS